LEQEIDALIAGYMFFNPKNNIQESKEDKQIKDNVNEDSEGDGIILFDDPLFPEELDGEE